MLLIVIGLGAAAVYFWFKYKRTKERLDYETTDVRNMAHTTVTMEMEEKKQEAYSHLESEPK